MRSTWDKYFMDMAELASTRATCIRRKVGAVLVKNRQILSTGYNGAPRSIIHCTKDTCIRNLLNIPSSERHELCMAVHAEQNAIVQAARHGIAIDGSVLYTTLLPCITCAKIVINAGVKEVIYKEDYGGELREKVLDMFTMANISCTRMKCEEV